MSLVEVKGMAQLDIISLNNLTIIVNAPTQRRRQAWITRVSSNTQLKTNDWRIQSQVRLRRTCVCSLHFLWQTYGARM